jgi:integrase
LLGAAIRDAEAAGDVAWQVGPAIRLLALTGCRRSEILELKWNEVDLEGGALRFADSKTGRSVRPLPDAAARILRHVRETYSKHSDYVLPGKPGSARHFTALTLPWTRILPTELKKLPPDNEDLSPHGLRHAFASLAHDMGCGELVIANMLGHSKGKSTTRGYIHNVDGIARRESNRVANAIAAHLEGETNVIQFDKEGAGNG